MCMPFNMIDIYVSNTYVAQILKHCHIICNIPHGCTRVQLAGIEIKIHVSLNECMNNDSVRATEPSSIFLT